MRLGRAGMAVISGVLVGLLVYLAIGNALSAWGHGWLVIQVYAWSAETNYLVPCSNATIQIWRAEDYPPPGQYENFTWPDPVATGGPGVYELPAGDYVAHITYAGDTVAIQAHIRPLHTLTRKVVFYPNGTYEIPPGEESSEPPGIPPGSGFASWGLVLYTHQTGIAICAGLIAGILYYVGVGKR